MWSQVPISVGVFQSWLVSRSVMAERPLYGVG